jgi:hypothetical protein
MKGVHATASSMRHVWLRALWMEGHDSMDHGSALYMFGLVQRACYVENLLTIIYFPAKFKRNHSSTFLSCSSWWIYKLFKIENHI